MTTTTETEIEVRPEIVRAIELSRDHETLANDERETTEARRAHRATMRAYDKALDEFLKGNYPKHAGGGIYTISSRTNAGTAYRVDVISGSCNCEGRCHCWHVKAAEICEDIRLANAQALGTPAAPAPANEPDEDIALDLSEDEERRLIAQLDHEQAPEPDEDEGDDSDEPEPVKETYADEDEEPVNDLYYKLKARGLQFRGDIGI